MRASLTPGTMVRHPAAPDWGTGMVQSVQGDRITVNFAERGKVTLDLRHVTLEPVAPPREPR
jgi:hypothetical protein